MTRTIEVAANAAATSWTDLTDKVRWEEMRVGGEAGDLLVGTGSGFDLDDDAGVISLPTKRVYRVIEDATASPTVLAKGRIADKTLARGQRFDDGARQHDVTLDDNNSQLRGIPVDGWERPAETGWARVQALMAEFAAGSPRASTDIDATTYAPNTNTVTMPKKTYDETDVAEVILDCAQTEGKQSFITKDDELFYDKDTSTAYAASCSITDDGADEETSFSPFAGVSVNQAGNEFFSRGKLKYGPDEAAVNDVRSAAETAHDFWGTVLTDGDADAVAAAAILGTMLDNQAKEELTIPCDIKMRADQVDLLAWGQTISFKAEAAAVASPTTFRIGSLYWEPIGNDQYIAHLELGVPKKWRRRVVKHKNPADTSGVGDGDTGCCPAWACTPNDYTVHSLADADVLAAVIPTHGNGQSVESTDSMIVYRGATYRIDYLVFHAAGSNNLNATLADFFGAQLGSPGPAVGAGVAPAVSMGDLGRYCQLDPTPDDIPAASSEWTVPAGTGDTMRVTAYLSEAGCAAGDSFASSISAHITWLEGPDPRFSGPGGACSNGLPTPNQEVDDPAETTTGDGVSTTDTTAHADKFGYAPGSLRVFVNGLLWPGVHELDPDAASIGYDYPPPLGSDVKRLYDRGVLV